MASTGLDIYGRRRLVQVMGTLLLFVGLYFLSAGRLDLLWGWVYLALSLASLAIGGLYVLRHNPQVINERGRPAESQKGWDKAIVAATIPFYLGMYIVAGLDARFGWTESMPLWLHLLGSLLTLLSAELTYSAMAHNPFLAQVVQISQQRGHQVATQGPYRWVRHPMYDALVIGWPGLALLLGSWWALIPAGLAAALIVARTALEDRTLLAELPGYPEYAARVRWRILPGVW
jgi:protein-S-isoprenylcysteine O-methyltransferase Ste14